jgi:hypothetical protein
MDSGNSSKKNVGGKKKLELSRETLRNLRVKTDVRTGVQTVFVCGPQVGSKAIVGPITRLHPNDC